MLLLSQYKQYFLSIFIGSILGLPYPLYGQITNQLYIGKNTTGSIGYLRLQTLPLNQFYTILEIKNIQCGHFVKGYTERQANRFILRTDIPDPKKDDDHQCQVTFIQQDQKLFVTKEDNCSIEHNIGCSFTSMIFSPTPTSLTSQQK